MKKIDIEIVDDFVSPSYLRALQDACGAECPWFIQTSQSLSDYARDNINDYGFSVGIVPPWQPDKFDQSPIATLVAPLIYMIKDYAQADHISRCRLDMTVLHDHYLHPPHIDIDTPHVASIVYLNETDGDTVIYDHQQEWAESYPTDMKVKTTISPKPGRMVLFDGSYVHTGYSPSDHQTRILINTVLS